MLPTKQTDKPNRMKTAAKNHNKILWMGETLTEVMPLMAKV
ncbi:hypothetical protein LMG9964_06758 [Paraburkholderia phenoliruptrix]|uniref:Uncharacterized protein n=1 Tax=Paraburkholderia phenoliruptrix TaxID=252970 RepID=A0A6J5KJJ9_9BURK|nr:hypothetical protein LMG9964_06758 [Paraburkholderia phenoliruptrix]